MHLSKANDKIKAFTLTEVMVTMVVSSLVILLAYAALQMINNYFIQTGHNNEVYSERLGLRTVLSTDIDQCDSIKAAHGAVQIYHNHGLISWYSDSSVVIRQAGVGDGVASKVFGVGINSINSFESNHRGLISRVALGLIDESGDSTFFNFYKHYALGMALSRGEVLPP